MLRGVRGSLDLYIVYLPTGADGQRERARIMRIIGDHIAPQQRVLSLIVGDFNFVSHTSDRWNKEEGKWSGDGDKKDRDTIAEALLAPHHFHEVYQPAFTCEVARARSRIDRIYSNHYVADQLDRHYSCTVRLWTRLSAHRPLSFARISPKRAPSIPPPIPIGPLTHPDWGRRVTLRYDEELARDSKADNPMRRIVMLKGAMRAVTKTMNNEGQAGLAIGVDDKLGWTMSCIRAAEDVNLNRVRMCVRIYPHLATYICPDDPNARASDAMPKLRDHAMQLAREAATEELRGLETTRDSSNFSHKLRKEQILTKLKRALPGNANTIQAMRTDDGEVTSDRSKIAHCLQKHWQHVFQRRPIDGELLERWLDSLPSLTDAQSDPNRTDRVDSRAGNDDRDRNRRQTRSDQHWRIRRTDVEEAIRSSGNSSPGPDGIPYLAWRSLGELGIQTLWDVAKLLETDQAGELMREAYADTFADGRHGYNLSTMVCLDKKPAGTEQTIGDYYTPEGTRPLAIVNCDNRLVANVARICWEGNLSNWVSQKQQGFLQGRSILANLIDLDTESMCASLRSNDGATILFDFRAAFPSISQDYLQTVLKRVGLPPSALNVVSWLYDANHCRISCQGESHPGFDMTARVRQGCPLSPLLYAAVAEVFLDKISAECPEAFVRAYADDTAIATSNFLNRTVQSCSRCLTSLHRSLG